MVVQYYQSHSRQTQVVNEHTSVEYVPLNEVDPHTNKQLRETVDKMKHEKFQQRFNELFEENMREAPDPSKNAWFQAETATYAPEQTVNASNLNATFETIKTRQREQGIVRYTGVSELSSFSGNASSLYDGIQPADEEDTYVSSDPFSKLKYEDLRKVHKDQTVFSVSENDYSSVPKYANVDQYSRARNSAPLTPMEKEQAQRILDERERIIQERQARNQHYTDLKSKEYTEKNKRIMGAFLHLENGGGGRGR